MTMGSGQATLGIHRGRPQDPFSQEDLKRVAPLIPHLRRMLDVRARLAHPGQRVLVAEAALNAQADAVAIADARGAPLFANVAAERLLAQGAGVCLVRGRITARRPSEAAALAAAITQACSTHAGASVRISLGEGSLVLNVVVAPCVVAGRSWALLMINDPAATTGDLRRHLVGLYGLTWAEASTIASLAAGQTPAEAAETRGVGLPTVRTQIQQALQKSGSDRLTDLLREIAMLPRVTGP